MDTCYKQLKKIVVVKLQFRRNSGISITKEDEAAWTIGVFYFDYVNSWAYLI